MITFAGVVRRLRSLCALFPKGPEAKRGPIYIVSRPERAALVDEHKRKKGGDPARALTFLKRFTNYSK